VAIRFVDIANFLSFQIPLFEVRTRDTIIQLRNLPKTGVGNSFLFGGRLSLLRRGNMPDGFASRNLFQKLVNTSVCGSDLTG
jgi:hypothetical protein